MRCTSCGAENRPGQKFCTKCGARITDGITPKPDLSRNGDSKGYVPSRNWTAPVSITLTLIGGVVLLLGFFQPWAIVNISYILGYHKVIQLDWVSILGLEETVLIFLVGVIAAVPVIVGIGCMGTCVAGALYKDTATAAAIVGFQTACVAAVLAVIAILAFMKGYLLLIFRKAVEEVNGVTGMDVEMGAAYKYLIIAFVLLLIGAAANAVPKITAPDRRSVKNYFITSISGTMIVVILGFVFCCLIGSWVGAVT